MKKKLGLIIITFFLFSNITAAIEVAPRITDREIIEGLTELKGDIKRVEGKIEKVEEGQKEVKEFILWGFGVTFAGIFTLIGFVLWDRRTALAPAIKKAKELEEREELLEKALKEYAKIEPRFADILKSLKI